MRLKKSPLFYRLNSGLNTYKKYLSLIITFAISYSVFGQVQIAVETTSPECSSNGIIEIMATGGSGNYTYILENDCGAIIPPQATPIFQTLEPCDYIISVKDNATNGIATTTATLVSNYEPINFFIDYESDCVAKVEVTGGNAPYTFQYSYNAYAGPFIDNMPATSPYLPNIEQNRVTIRVQDACGNTREKYREIKKNPIEDHELNYEPNGIKILSDGGIAPYTFEIISDNNIVSSNSTGVFEWAELACEPKIRIRDECNSIYEEALEISLAGRVECSNISEGTFILTATRGVAPFRFEIETPGENYFSDTGTFTNLPINRAYYRFFIYDACDNREQITSSSRYKPSFFSYPIDNCQNESLSFKVDRQCTGVERYPLLISCLSCVPQEELMIENGSALIEFNGNISGEWEIGLQDNCGETTTCRDEIKLELTPACDSITARIIDFFRCDNGTTARREIQDQEAVFSLFDDQGLLLEAYNKSGVFKNLVLGRYRVMATTPSCDTLESTINIEEPRPLSVRLETNIYTREDSNNQCGYRYRVKVEQSNGPFILTGGPDGEYRRLLNDYGEDNCLHYVVSNLLPGTYFWKSLSSCGVDTMILPVPDFDLNASIDRICASGNTIEVTGGRNLNEWLDWFEPYELNIDLSETTVDYYTIKSDQKEARSSGTNFYGLSSGEHLLYLQPFNKATCVVDSITINIPTYRPAKLEIGNTILCDNEATIDLAITMQGGQAPYRLEALYCENGARKELIRTEDGNFVLDDVPKGEYCFVAKDGCGVSNDIQVNVRQFTDSINYEYTCDSMLTLSVDSIRADYLWKDETGDTIGKDYQLTMLNPVTSTQPQLAVQFGNCLLERTIALPSRTIIPTLDLLINRELPILCGPKDTIQLSANTDAETLEWNTGDTVQDLRINSPGFYLGTVINDLGCEKADTIEILQKTMPEPKIGQTAFCQDDKVTELFLEKKYAQITWSNKAQMDTIEVATQGDYWVIVQDEYNCVGVDNFSLKRSIMQAELLAKDPLCYDSQDGFMAIGQVHGGTGAYQLAINENPFPLPFKADDLAFGAYSIILTDSFQCTWDTMVHLIRPAELSLILNSESNLPILCGSEDAIQLTAETDVATIQWNTGEKEQNITVTNPAIYTATVTNSVGCQKSASLEILQKSIPTPKIQQTAFCQESEITQLFLNEKYESIRWSNRSQTDTISVDEEQIYWVEVQDENKCSGTDTLMLKRTLLRPDLLIQDPLCFGNQDGFIAVDQVQGGNAPYQLNWEQEQIAVPWEINDLAEGVYKLKITDSSLCSWDTTLQLFQPEPLMLDVGEDQILKFGDSLQLIVTSNFEDWQQWEWTANGLPLIDAIQMPTVCPITSTIYKLSVSNTNGCNIEDELLMNINRNIPVYAPNVFSPDGDGINDLFMLYVKGNTIKSIQSLKIFDRFGNQVFAANNLSPNDYERGWNGQYKGKLANVGVYIWSAEIVWKDNKKDVMSGDVTLLKMN